MYLTQLVQINIVTVIHISQEHNIAFNGKYLLSSLSFPYHHVSTSTLCTTLSASKVTSEVKRPTADTDAVVTTRRQSYVRMGDPEERRMSLGKRRRSTKEDIWDVTMDLEEEVEYVPWSGT